MHRSRRPGFTLIELLVVVTIVVIVSAVVLPTVVSSYGNRGISEGARILQAAVQGARDAAIRANEPRGIRLMPDPASSPLGTGVLMMNRMVQIEPAPKYSTGRVSILNAVGAPHLILTESLTTGTLPNERTSWYWNVRVGDKVRIGGTNTGAAGLEYTVVGPMTIGYVSGSTTQYNAEKFVNAGAPGTDSDVEEVLWLVNGVDDNGNGYIDEGFDGLDNDNNPVGSIDEADEWETEQWSMAIRSTPSANLLNLQYEVSRRPVPTQGARETVMPSGTVIDFTTGAEGDTNERSRASLESGTFYVDIMVSPNGSIVPTTLYSTPAKFTSPYVHLWVCDRADVIEPQAAQDKVAYRLPMPEGTPNYPDPDDTLPVRELEGDRRLVTINMRSGLVTTTEPTFDGSSVLTPFIDARLGGRSAD